MSQLTKRMQDAVRDVATMPAEQQDLIAREMLARARELAETPLWLSPEERAELEAELAAARRGEFASDHEVAAMYAIHS
jgi:hypothetical protein